jgi:hypothetical protein
MTETTTRRMESVAPWLAACLGLAVGAYGTYVGLTWLRYGDVVPPRPEDADELLDRFMPIYEVVERKHTRVAAPAAVTLAAARELDLFHVPAVKAIFKAREAILGSTPDSGRPPRGLLAGVQTMGWRVLAEVPDREVVVGAVTRPWEPNPTFRPLPPDEFTSFSRPGYVKIVWTLRADPDGPHRSVFRTETRAVATDAAARERFRRYWAFLSPGIIFIRWLSLGPVRAAAERRVRTGEGPGSGEGSIRSAALGAD